MLLRKLTCVPECTDARTCPRRFSCPYARMFEPHAIGHGPSGFADPPRPFVFRAAHLDGCRVPAGSRFHFDVHVFDVRNPAPQYFALAFAQLAREGLGPGRGRAELLRVEQLGRDRQPAAVVFQGAGFADPDLAPPIVIGLRPAPKPVRRVRIRFLTPTELKAAGELALRPEFAILFARIRDRLSALRTFYGAGPLAMDFRGMGQRAGRVALGRTALRWSETSRRSGRTGQQHPFGGFTGEVEYEGELAEFLPFLEAAQWTGVGRQAVWGKGEISVAVAA
ncbi:MAG: CRISPR system precrRNA processing endoribonuclease RAMP protein Cas6 [Bryobacterales bacterium]|nr:CRISPR system precrRNA processing endoribonuclease RAMP protein Cas6 [Bryobacterales bacterium]